MIEELRRRARDYKRLFRLTRNEAYTLLEEIEELERKYAEARALLLEVVTTQPPTQTSRGWGACR